MAGKDSIVDMAQLDFDNVVADIDQIREHLPQRFEMEQLTAIVFISDDHAITVGYKDVGHDEFWVRGHMPGMPLMPGVVMCEAAAQLASYSAHRFDMMEGNMVGFGGMEDVRFRGPVVPGDRLVLMCQMLKLRPGRMIVSRFQGFVGETMVVDGRLKGIPLPVDALKNVDPRP